MTALATAIRPQPLVCQTFQAFDLWDADSITANAGEVFPRGEKCNTLADALACAPNAHKAKFIVKQIDMLTGRVTLKFYTIRQKSRPEYRYHDFQTRAVRDTYAEHLHDLVLSQEVTAI